MSTTFNKLNLSIDNSVTVIHLNDYEISVKNYLSVEQKSKLIEFVLAYAFNPENNSETPLMANIATVVGITKYYTDISFTENQLGKDFLKTYDKIVSSGLFQQVFDVIPTSESNLIMTFIDKSIAAYKSFINSLLNIIQSMAKESTVLDKNLTDMFDKIQNKKGVELIDEIMKKEVGQS